MQVVQDAVGRVVLNVVKSPDWDESIRAALAAEFRGALGAGLVVDLEFVPTIPREANGKYRFSICRVPRPGAGA
jgi:phenylacetate-CoA ligase